MIAMEQDVGLDVSQKETATNQIALRGTLNATEIAACAIYTRKSSEE